MSRARLSVPASTIAGALCRKCAICCNGVLFHDVKLGAGENADRLGKHAGRVVVRRGKSRLMQPCPLLKDSECVAYRLRPEHCRQFECVLFLRVRRGTLALDQARSLARTTLLLAERVRNLLDRLDGRKERLALRARYTLAARSVEKRGADARAALLFSRLSLAFHRLNLRLQRHFH